MSKFFLRVINNYNYNYGHIFPSCYDVFPNRLIIHTILSTERNYITILQISQNFQMCLLPQKTPNTASTKFLLEVIIVIILTDSQFSHLL